MRHLRAAAIQFEHVAGDKQSNFVKIERFAAEAAGRGAELIVFPECCITGYWFLCNLSKTQLLEIAETVPEGPSTRRLLELSRTHNAIIGAGLIESDGEHLYNSYVVALPDGQWHCHRKIQAFESDHIASGGRYTVFDSPRGVRIGVLICYDNNIIENARITALMGAEVLLAPHQTGGCNSVSPHGMKPIDPRLWHDRATNPAAIEAELCGPKGKGLAHALAAFPAHDNGMFIIFSNGVGIDDDEVRTGNAMILDPYGRMLAETNRADDDMVVADLDLELIAQSTGRRWLRARRPDLYAPLVKATGNELNTRAVRFDRPK